MTISLQGRPCPQRMAPMESITQSLARSTTWAGKSAMRSLDAYSASCLVSFAICPPVTFACFDKFFRLPQSERQADCRQSASVAQQDFVDRSQASQRWASIAIGDVLY